MTVNERGPDGLGIGDPQWRETHRRWASQIALAGQVAGLLLGVLAVALGALVLLGALNGTPAAGGGAAMACGAALLRLSQTSGATS